jgi:TonB-dependent SusC/RagA subfamily outer membrane receptor
MKHILLFTLLLLSLNTFAQRYEKQWENVVTLETNGLIKQASAAADSIYILARKQHNEPQIIKAFFFRSKYVQTLDQDAQITIIKNIRAEIKTSAVPARAILESLYAEILSAIYNKDSYHINNRTNVSTFAPESIALWSGNNFVNEINDAYFRSLLNKEVLYKKPLSDYEAIINFNPVLANTHRSLYDFLLERYYENARYYDPFVDQYALQPHLKLLYGDSDTFTKATIHDSIGKNFKDRITLFKDTEHFYTVKKDSLSLQRAVLRRLAYLDTKISMPLKNDIEIATLEQLAKKWGKSPFAYRAMLMHADLLKTSANKSTAPQNLKKALALYNSIIKDAAYNDVAPQAINSRNDITSLRANLLTEKFIAPNSPTLAQITFKNTDAITVRIYKISNKQAKNVETIKHTDLPTPVVSKTYTLPNRGDFFEYTTEIVLPPLPTGFYLITAVIDGKENNEYRNFVFNVVQCTNLAVTEHGDNEYKHYQITDRATGKPIKNAIAIADNKTYSSDKFGVVKLSAFGNNATKEVLIHHEGDTLDTSFYAYKTYGRNSDTDNSTATANFYLDRAIYRPGQTVYFKGIITQHKKNISGTVPNASLTVVISDANDDELTKIRVKTNEYGSFTGEYTLPANVLTGEFTIEIDEDDEAEENEDDSFWDDVYFSSRPFYFKVEEYKKPTFEVVFNPVTNDVKLNTKTGISGNAKSFSGAVISNAKVVYKVTRSARMSRYIYNNYNRETAIANGEITTDANGKFTVEFTAEPDTQLDRTGLPVFTYDVYVTVTDSNGETHDGTKAVYAGYHSLLLSANIPEIINAADGGEVTFDSKNLNSEFRPAEGEITVYKLVEANRISISRPWAAPEIQTIPQQEFEKLFPYLPYYSVSKDTVIRGNRVFTEKVNTAKSKKMNRNDFKNWVSGSYQLVFTAKDSLNNPVEATALFNLTKDSDTQLPGNKLFLYEIKNKNYKKDGFVTLQLKSSLPVLYINVLAHNTHKVLYTNLVQLKEGKATIKLPFNKRMDKQMGISMDFVWQNQHFTENALLDVAPKHQKIEIESQTITNKLVPGSNQNWSFIIKDSTKTPAEVLASMYDTSLDQFATDYWQLLNPDENRSTYNAPYKNILTRGDNYSYFNIREPNVTVPVLNDQLYMFGFGITNTNKYWSQIPKMQLPGSRPNKVIGIVSDTQGMPIPGVSVNIKGTTEGTNTDLDGQYTIYVFTGDIIQYDFVSMKSQSFTSQKSGTINVTLEDYASMLEEVVVVGYGTMQKQALTGTATRLITPDMGYSSGDIQQLLRGKVAGVEILQGSGQPGAADTIRIRGLGSLSKSSQPMYVVDGIPLSENEYLTLDTENIVSVSVLKDSSATALYGSRGANGVVIIQTKTGTDELLALQQVQARKNFKETAFFYPQLTTDNKGRIAFNFTTPEALTQWKLRLLAHNKKGASGYFENTFVTQKDLMVVPNMPRFLREKDTIVIKAKITNMTSESKRGSALLQLFDAVTMQPADTKMLNMQSVKPFTLAAKGSSTVSWTIAVPTGMQGVQYKILAKAGDFSDGEENVLPVLTNSMLVTESLPLWVKPNTTKTYTFNNLKNNTSATLRNHGITLEYTSNPAWVALQALPYLIEYEHECAEQVFSRFYANAIATHIINSNPKIAEVFATWKASGKTLSKLEQNEELKSIIIAETPWLRDAESDAERKNRISLLFEMDKMKSELTANFKKLEDKQLDSGAFAWFGGNDANPFITRHILAGFGHLNKLNIKISNQDDTDALIKLGINYTDAEFLKQYKSQISLKNKKPTVLSNPDLHYLYMRSFHIAKNPVNDSLMVVIKKQLINVKDNWLTYSLYNKGMAALALHRLGDNITAKKIIASLKDSSATNDENGMFWIDNNPGWYWYNAPIETQALLIEAFTEITGDVNSADAMKVWLIKQKQNKNWPTTKATAEAVYALLMQGTSWLSVKENTTFKLGNEKLLTQKIAESGPEAGTGYIKLNWKPEEVTKEMATLTVENKSVVPGYGGFYWQYFEELDKIKSSQESIMNVGKELYLKNNTANGMQLQKISAKQPLKIGDLVTMRLILDIKENVEFVHLKDLRAAAFEPVDVLSAYEYKDHLGYYRSTRDVATHFFLDYISRGKYILEYDVRVNNAGEFSSGITTILSMYAPEFSGHTAGVRVKTSE